MITIDLNARNSNEEYSVDPKTINSIQESIQYLTDNLNYPITNLDSETVDIKLQSNSYNKLIITDDKEYVFNLDTPTNASQTNEYIVEIDCTSNVATFVFSEDIKWKDEKIPVLNLGKKCFISIINNLGVWGEF